MKVEYLLTCYWIQSSLRCRELPRNCFVPLFPVWQYINGERAAELNDLQGKTDQIFVFLPKEAAFNLMWYPSCWRHLGFHFYLSIMHEVAEIRPRSARAPLQRHSHYCYNTDLFSHSCQPSFTSSVEEKWLHDAKLRLSADRLCYYWVNVKEAVIVDDCQI